MLILPVLWWIRMDKQKPGLPFQERQAVKNFGLTWNAVTEAGQVVVSDDIRLQCEIQLVKQA
jgi:hypothetical protein